MVSPTPTMSSEYDCSRLQGQEGLLFWSTFKLWFWKRQFVKNLLQCRRPGSDSWVGKIRWRWDRLPTPVFLGFPCGSAGRESTCNAGDLGLISGLGRSPEEGKGYPLQYSGWRIPWTRVARSRTRLSDFHFTSDNQRGRGGQVAGIAVASGPRQEWAGVAGAMRGRKVCEAEGGGSQMDVYKGRQGHHV